MITASVQFHFYPHTAGDERLEQLSSAEGI